jgi:hypothetical protein
MTANAAVSAVSASEARRIGYTAIQVIGRPSPN